jgi:hypothetical protein
MVACTGRSRFVYIRRFASYVFPAQKNYLGVKQRVNEDFDFRLEHYFWLPLLCPG